MLSWPRSACSKLIHYGLKGSQNVSKHIHYKCQLLKSVPYDSGTYCADDTGMAGIQLCSERHSICTKHTWHVSCPYAISHDCKYITSAMLNTEIVSAVLGNPEQCLNTDNSGTEYCGTHILLPQVLSEKYHFSGSPHHIHVGLMATHQASHLKQHHQSCSAVKQAVQSCCSSLEQFLRALQDALAWQCCSTTHKQTCVKCQLCQTRQFSSICKCTHLQVGAQRT